MSASRTVVPLVMLTPPKTNTPPPRSPVAAWKARGASVAFAPNATGRPVSAEVEAADLEYLYNWRPNFLRIVPVTFGEK